MEEIIRKINETGDKVFFKPIPTFTYDQLVFERKVLESNTYRWFHRRDKLQKGAKEAFDSVLKKEKQHIINSLINAKSEIDIDNLEIYLCKWLKEELKKNTKLYQLESFNKLRKPIDIVIEHLVAMGEEFNSVRQNLINYLFLPLDSRMFQSEIVFSDNEVKALKIKRCFSFKDIEEWNNYYKIQAFLKNKAKEIGIKNRIYFDLVWWNRYENDTNLFGDKLSE